MLSAICFNLDQSKNLLSCNGLNRVLQLLSTIFQSCHSDSSHNSCLSWVYRHGCDISLYYEFRGSVFTKHSQEPLSTSPKLIFFVFNLKVTLLLI